MAQPMDGHFRVGIFGGTFDPPHIGHLIVSGEVVEEANLDQLLWVPAATPPHKGGGISSEGLRTEMVQAAIEDDPRIEFSDVELKRGGVSYTIDTLRDLKAAHPAWSLSLVIGSDQADSFHEWREPDAILELAELIVMSRDGTPGPEFETGKVTRLSVTRIDVSSTRIRERIAQGKSVRYMVTDHVLSIIEREKLYRE